MNLCPPQAGASQLQQKIIQMEHEDTERAPEGASLQQRALRVAELPEPK